MIMRRAKAMLIISIALLSLVSCGGSSQRTMYKEAMQAVEDESYEDAIDILTELGDYKDAPDQLLNAWYLYGTQLFEQGELDLAEEVFTQLGDYSESAQMLDDIHYKMAEQLFSAGEYNLAMGYYNELPTAYADKVQNRIRLIECAETADRITAELQGDNNTLNFYMGMFGLEFDFDLHYEASDYTYYFDVYCAKGFSTIASLFGSSLEELTKDSTSSGMEKTIYLKFRDAGYEDITCAMRYFDYSGNLLYSYSYSELDYQRDGEAQYPAEIGPTDIGADIPGDTRSNPFASFEAEQDYLITRMLEQTASMSNYEDGLTHSFIDDYAGIYVEITAFSDSLGNVTYYLHYSDGNMTFEAVPFDYDSVDSDGTHSVTFDLGKYFTVYDGTVEVILSGGTDPLLWSQIPYCVGTDGEYFPLRILDN